MRSTEQGNFFGSRFALPIMESQDEGSNLSGSTQANSKENKNLDLSKYEIRTPGNEIRIHLLEPGIWESHYDGKLTSPMTQEVAQQFMKLLEQHSAEFPGMKQSILLYYSPADESKIDRNAMDLGKISNLMDGGKIYIIELPAIYASLVNLAQAAAQISKLLGGSGETFFNKRFFQKPQEAYQHAIALRDSK